MKKIQRNLLDIFTITWLKYIKYIPYFFIYFNQWLFFLINYILLDNSIRIYSTRKWTKILSKWPDDLWTIVEIFIKKEYWEINWNNLKIIDIWANTWIFSTYCLENTSNSIIYSYEPFINAFNQLNENIELNINKSSKILATNSAVWAINWKIKFYLTNQTLTNSIYPNPEYKNQQYIEVPVITLERILDKNKITELDILKMDCEWSEYEILYNTSDEIFEKIKEIRLEFHNIDVSTKNWIYLKKFLEWKWYKTVIYKNHIDNRNTAWFLLFNK